MATFPFRILNVFTVGEDNSSGNPLCVFEDGAQLPADQMQALARQFNLSETTFILPPSTPDATARVRIFTPTFEMPFAGHPTLGTAHVVRALLATTDRVVLEMKAGLVEVEATGDEWTLRTARAAETRQPRPSHADFAAMLGLQSAAVLEEPLWVDTGAEQLVIPLATPDDVRRARPDPALLAKFAFSDKRGASMAYVWARASTKEAIARFFFLSHGGVVEDPATGSACANLGGWMVATKCPLPLKLRIHQGEAVGRASLLKLDVDANQTIRVSGTVRQVGRGTMEWA
jgi:trans-2,3-dihydro-3-hydroxyanthranilate isomerase